MSYASAIYGKAAQAVERYDPKRYAGREPPHRCTVASATAIAQQLPGAPWKYAGTVASVAGMSETTEPVIRRRWAGRTSPSGTRAMGRSRRSVLTPAQISVCEGLIP